MPAPPNYIDIDGNGNITIQGVDNSSITINTHNPDKVVEQLRQLNKAQIDSLMQVVSKQNEQLPELFRNILKEFYDQRKASLPKELTLNLPRIHPDDIVGREEDLEGLHELLKNEKRVVVVNGLGGIGKTTLAQAYLSKYYEEYAHIAWITHSSENIAADFINDGGLIQNLSVETAGLEPGQVFQEILRKLKGIAERPNLLIIDNGEQSLSKDRNKLPSQPQWHLLVTSREEIAGFHIRPLDFLSEQQAMELFRKHYPLQKLTDQEIKELVQAVDYHTLTIEILAKTAKVQRYDAATLKRAVEGDLRANVEVAHNKEPDKIENVRSYLSKVFSLSRLSEEMVWLLKQFACLPSDFHPYELLEELLLDEESPYKDTFAETLSGLAQKGWLLQNLTTDSYKMHRIIAEVVKKEHPVSAADVHTLLVAFTSRLKIDEAKDNPVDKFSWVPFGKALTQIFREGTSPEIAKLQNNLALVLRALGEYAGARELLEKAVRSSEKNFGPHHPSTALSYSNLASVLQALGEYSKAFELSGKALSTFKKTLPEGHPFIKIVSNKI